MIQCRSVVRKGGLCGLRSGKVRGVLGVKMFGLVVHNISAICRDIDFTDIIVVVFVVVSICS